MRVFIAVPFALVALGPTWSRNVDRGDAGCGGALGDVEGEQREGVCFRLGLHGPPDRVSAGAARCERRLAAKRAVVALERGEHDTAVVRLVSVVEHEAGHGARLTSPGRAD